MRYLSANYIFSISSPPLKNGIACVDQQGMIVDLIDTGGKLEEREKLEFYNGILVPGFVNAHCHLELSHLRGFIGKHTGLPDFLSAIGSIRTSDDELILSAAKMANDEMTRNGIVAVGDISNCADTISIKRNSRIRYHTFIEIFGLDNSRAKTIFSNAQQLEHCFHEARLSASIVPHAIYSLSEKLFDMLGQYYAMYPAITSIHHQESSEETSLYHKGKGILFDTFRKSGLISAGNIHRPHIVEEMEQCLSLAQQCLLVHNTFTSQDNIRQRMKHLQRVYWTLCPGSNLYIQNRLPDLSLFADNHLSICLGTDSLASNLGLSILEEMKVIQQHVPDIPLAILLQWATLNGAQALGFADALGSIEKGKTPGINLITHIDFTRMQITKESTVKIIANCGKIE